MLRIQITNKFIYTVYRNKRYMQTFSSKKSAKDYLYNLKKDFEELNNQQNLFNIYPVLFEQGEKMVVFSEKRRTLNPSASHEFRDTYRIIREINPKY